MNELSDNPSSLRALLELRPFSHAMHEGLQHAFGNLFQMACLEVPGGAVKVPSGRPMSAYSVGPPWVQQWEPGQLPEGLLANSDRACSVVMDLSGDFFGSAHLVMSEAAAKELSASIFRVKVGCAYHDP